MKRIPPSVTMKEEVEALLGGNAACDSSSTPMEGFVRATARYMLQVAIEAEASAFLGRGHYRREGIGCGWDGETVMSPRGCRPRQELWNWRSRNCAPPRSGFVPSW
jgi:hypothetical protein